ncbi:MAG: tetratricopeptide repeat protein [Ghiorsea sp.]|nr:tetratricopeptide repeat protein [Ghiorsea sp.]
MSNKKKNDMPIEGVIDGTDFVELKRDMQSAKVIAWLQYNQQQLIAGAVVLVLGLVGSSLWQAQQASQKEAAALLYIQATNTSNMEEKAALFDNVIATYPDSGYAILARLKKSTQSGVDEQKSALKSLIGGQGAPEFAWQARLDLAEIFISEHRHEKAKEILLSRMGSEYEQARFALLAQATVDTDEKMTLIQKALDAASHDEDLNAALKAELAQLKAFN